MVADAGLRSRSGRVVQASMVGDQACLTVRHGDGRSATIWVDCVPDPVRARAEIAGLRRLLAVRLTVHRRDLAAHLFAIRARHPIVRPIAVSTALVLAADRIPVHVVIS
jgi:hypothetical protein